MTIIRNIKNVQKEQVVRIRSASKSYSTRWNVWINSIEPRDINQLQELIISLIIQSKRWLIANWCTFAISKSRTLIIRYITILTRVADGRREKYILLSTVNRRDDPTVSHYHALSMYTILDAVKAAKNPRIEDEPITAKVTPNKVIIWPINTAFVNWATQIQVPTIDKSVPKPRTWVPGLLGSLNWKIQEDKKL